MNLPGLQLWQVCEDYCYILGFVCVSCCCCFGFYVCLFGWFFLQTVLIYCLFSGSNCSSHLPKSLSFCNLIYMVTLKQGGTLKDCSVLMNDLSGTGWLLQWLETLFLQVLFRSSRLQAQSCLCLASFNIQQLAEIALIWRTHLINNNFNIFRLLKLVFNLLHSSRKSWCGLEILKLAECMLPNSSLGQKLPRSSLCRHRENLHRSFKGRCLICLILSEVCLLSFLQPFHLFCLSTRGLAPWREVQAVNNICIQCTAYNTSSFSWTRRSHKLFGPAHWPKNSRTSTFTTPQCLWKGSKCRLRVCSLMLNTCSSSGKHFPRA